MLVAYVVMAYMQVHLATQAFALSADFLDTSLRMRVDFIVRSDSACAFNRHTRLWRP